MAKTTHTLLLAHGSRDPQWSQPFYDLLDTLRMDENDPSISLCFMELTNPLLDEALQSLIKEGIYSISVIPLFFSAGKHLRIDVPSIIENIQKSHPSCEIKLKQPIGTHPKVLEAIQYVLRNNE